MTTEQKSLTEENEVREGETVDASDDDKTVETTADSTADSADTTDDGIADDATAEVDDAPVGEVLTEGDGADGAGRRSRWTLIGIGALAVLLAASAGLTAWLYFAKYRPDQQAGPAAQNTALEAAKTGTVAALSYSPETLDKDLDTAKSHMTGDFLTYYTKFTDDVVRKAVNEKKVSTTANVVRAAVTEIHPDTAKALVFVNQSTTSADRQEPSMAASSVVVTLTKIDGKWLISAFDPI